MIRISVRSNVLVSGEFILSEKAALKKLKELYNLYVKSVYNIDYYCHIEIEKL